MPCRTMLLFALLAMLVVVARATEDHCHADCRSPERSVGPTRPGQEQDPLRNPLRLTKPHPYHVADTEKYTTEEFCLLGCTYFFVSSQDHESGKSTLDQCLDQCDDQHSWNAPHPPYNDLVAVARLECRDGCLMALQRCQPGYYCSQVTFDGEDASSYTGGDMISCPAGTYRDVSYEAVTECVPCPPNYFREDVKGRSLASCSPCPAGTSAVDPGSDSIKDCVRCPAGSFSTEASFCSCITPQACAEDQLPPPADAEKKDTVPYIGRW